MIYDALEYTHEADIFANQQKFVKPLTPYDTFIANIEAKNPEQLTLKALVESYDLKISKISEQVVFVLFPHWNISYDDIVRFCKKTPSEYKLDE